MADRYDDTTLFDLASPQMMQQLQWPVSGATDEDVYEAMASEEYVDETVSSSTNLTKLSKYAFTNPLNPKTPENLNKGAYRRRTQNRPTVPESTTTSKRWISVQAHNHRAFLDAYDTNEIETGLIITVTKKPSNADATWDEVIDVQDITPYVSSHWSGGGSPVHAASHWTVTTSDHIILKYRDNAFAPAPGYGNIPTTHGVFELDLRVTFASGHVEYFTAQNFPSDNGPILAPVGNQYDDRLDHQWDPLGAGTYTEKIQEVKRCERRAGFSNAWYSKGSNTLQGVNAIGDYSILTRYKPIYNPSGTLIEAGLYKEYYNSATNYAFVRLVNEIGSGWGDPLTQMLGAVNGVITPDQTQTAKQSFSRLDVLFQHSNNNYQSQIWGNNIWLDKSWFASNYQYSGTGYTYYDTSFTGTANSAYDQLHSRLLAANQMQYLFTYTVYYSENITSCGPGTGGVNYDVCATKGNPSYFVTTGLDCYGNAIPTADLPGGSNYANVTYSSGACCTSCTLQVQATGTDADFGSTNGYVTWSAIDSSTGLASGNTWGSGSLYTVAITDANGAVVGTVLPTGGNTVTDATCDTTHTGTSTHLVGCDSNTVIKPGMQVSGTGIPANTYVGAITGGVVSVNVTQFELRDVMGNIVSATATNTNTTLTFSTGMYGIHGALAPNDASNTFYQVCVTDEDNCEECVQFVIRESSTQPTGCTDNSAVNYDPTAVQDDGSCILCEAATGLLVDPSGTNTTSLFDSLVATPTAATHNSGYGSSTTHNSDGTLAVSAAPIAAVIGSMDWDANSKFELLLYKTVNPGDASTATGATQIGGTINAGTLDIVTVASHNFTGLAYGYYTIRVRYVDTNTVSTLENCWTEFYGIVPAEVCTDQTNSQYMSVPTDPSLREANHNLCSTNIPCCIVTTPSEHPTRSTLCVPVLYSDISCDPGRTVDIVWSYSPNGTTYTTLGSFNVGNITSSSMQVFANSGNNPVSGTNWVTQTGFYKITLTGTANLGHGIVDVCVEERILNFNFPVTGCMDATAHNYDALAQCPGPCAFPSWDCEQSTGMCIDPWNGTFTGYTPGPYNCLNGPGCCNSYCTPPVVYGCTDPCAHNYDSTATQDDGSCVYAVCTQATATNYLQNCCNGISYPLSMANISDPNCCIDPCATQNTVSIATTDSTSTCTTFNTDGTVAITVTINNSAPSWTWEIWDASNTTLIYTDPTTYSGSTTSSTYSLLGSGNYNVKVTDSWGCWQIEHFTIGSTSPQVGCMDPDADNYDPNAICDCCCIVAGCLDPNATNYNPNANVPGPCEYPPVPPSPCIPESLKEDQKLLNLCISQKGSKWLRDYKIGRADDCTLMNKWKLILIDYLLKQDNLSCLYNCADIQTPDPTAAKNCHDLWVTGGTSTGLNHDTNHLGASIVTPGEGTTITAYDGYPAGWFGYDSGGTPTSNKSFVGDVVKFDLPVGHPLASWLNGTIWTLTTIPPNPLGMHQGCKNQKIQHYTQCLDYRTVSITTTTNYYDNFINFVNKFCEDCDTKILKNNSKLQ